MHSHRPHQINNKNLKQNQSMTRTLLIVLAVLAVIGVILTAFMIPSESKDVLNPTALFPGHSQKLSEKVLNWIPHSHAEGIIDEDIMELPPWDAHEVWTPIDIDIQEDPIVILCKLNFHKYWDQPHSYPMFRDLESASNCIGANRRRSKMSVLLKELDAAKDTPEGRVVPPTGFVFHESRVGSTLIANFLASDPWALVFSESTPVANAILHCTTCSKQRQIELFRNVMTLMGRSPYHKRLFIKSQSITTTRMHIPLEAFPDTPWAFVFRTPVQTMMSHLDPAKGSGAAPCLRSKRSPPPEVSKALEKVGGATFRTSNEAWCAAHLNMLCTFALQAYDKFNSTISDNSPRALLINYESLPGAVPRALLPHFHVTPSKAWLKKMEVESKHYSKSRTTKFRLFVSDSEDKDSRATTEIQSFATSLLEPSFQLLNARAVQSMLLSVPQALQTEAKEKLHRLETNALVVKEDTAEIWKSISPLPTADELPTSTLITSTASSHSQEHDEDNRLHFGHSYTLPEKEFESWLPFSNHHHSNTFYQPDCPLIPPQGYPKTFSMLDIINNWNPDDTNIPAFHYDSICHFDGQNATQLQAAMLYRAAEVPFILYNIPEVDAVVKKWNNLDYLSKLLGSKSYRTEVSDSNHFMYWHGGANKFASGPGGKKKAWKQPTKVTSRKFEEWLEHAVKNQNKSVTEREHEYFRVSSDMGNPWLFKELPFFQPKESIYIVNPREQRGIHCRFGMRGVIAEAHWDGSRNAVVMLGGMRRWVLTHPDQCKVMHMYLNGHPSGRHSAVNWSAPDIQEYPNFAKVVGNEVILRPGDYLFVPTYWIHFIVSLNVNFQCNTRSGIYTGYNKYLRECGF